MAGAALVEQTGKLERAAELLAAEEARGAVPDPRLIAAVVGALLGVLRWLLDEPVRAAAQAIQDEEERAAAAWIAAQSGGTQKS